MSDASKEDIEALAELLYKAAYPTQTLPWEKVSYFVKEQCTRQAELVVTLLEQGVEVSREHERQSCAELIAHWAKLCGGVAEFDDLDDEDGVESLAKFLAGEWRVTG